MASNRVAAGITSLAHSSSAAYSTSANANFQFILDRKRPVYSQRVVPSRRLCGDGNGAGRRQGCNYGFRWNASRRLCGWWFASASKRCLKVDKGILATKQGGPHEETEVGDPRGQRWAGFSVGILSASGTDTAVAGWMNQQRQQVMDYFGEENRPRNCPSGRTHRWPTALRVSYCGQGLLSTNRQRDALRNEGDRRTPLLQFKKNPNRTAKSAFPNDYSYRGIFFA